MPYYKPKKGPRDGVPTITVPRTLTQCTYFNVPLAMLLQEAGIEKLNFSIDKEAKQISIFQPKEGEKGYKVRRTGQRGWGVTPKLRTVLPAGRYRLVHKTKLIFARA